MERGSNVNRRTCPWCGGRSYSSYSGTNWECPYCGKNLGHLPNETVNPIEDYREDKKSSKKIYMIRGGSKEKHFEPLS